MIVPFGGLGNLAIDGSNYASTKGFMARLIITQKGSDCRDIRIVIRTEATEITEELRQAAEVALSQQPNCQHSYYDALLTDGGRELDFETNIL